MLPSNIKYTNRIIKGEDSQGNSTINQYSVEGDLGEGSFGQVKLVTDNEVQQQFAMKQFSKSRLRKQKEYMKNPATGEVIQKNAYIDTLREVKIMAQLGDGHGSIIELHEVIDSEKDDKLILIIDYAKFGEIQSCDEETMKFETCLENKKYFNETDIQRIMRDCIIGLDVIHEANIVHRDIKP